MCGIFGVFGSKEAAELTYLGLYALLSTGRGKRRHRRLGRFARKLHPRDGSRLGHFYPLKSSSS